MMNYSIRWLKSKKRAYTWMACILVAMINGSAVAGLFGPSNYEECLIEVSKTARTDQAVSTGTVACGMKFSADRDKNKQAPGAYVDGRCNFVWNGFEFSPGVRKSPEYTLYSIPHSDGFTVGLWIKRALSDEWNKGRNEFEVDRIVKSLLMRHETYLIEACKAMTPK